MLKINNQLAIPSSEFEFRFSRSPGPGGQNVNKLNTKVTLRWNVAACATIPQHVLDRLKKKYANRINKDGVFLISSHRYRDQGRNIADCLEKLRAFILSVATLPKARKKTKPSKRSNQRRLESKKRNAEKKQSRRCQKFDWAIAGKLCRQSGRLLFSIAQNQLLCCPCFAIDGRVSHIHRIFVVLCE